VVDSAETFNGKFGTLDVNDLMARNVICQIKTVIDLLSKGDEEVFSEQLNHVTRMHLRQVTLTLFTQQI